MAAEKEKLNWKKIQKIIDWNVVASELLKQKKINLNHESISNTPC